jgi:assimilatory nitrate reductase catalytic subunit
VQQAPGPYVEVHPTLAARLGIQESDLVLVETRRASLTFPARVVTSIRPDTVFVPYHWPGVRSVNQLTVGAQDAGAQQAGAQQAGTREVVHVDL